MGLTNLWQETWDSVLERELEHERSGDYQPHEFYTSGRKSAKFPDKENPAWWAENGPKFVASWVNWRDNCGLDILEVTDQETGELIPAIELPVQAERPQPYGKMICVIDRVFTDGEDLYIVDIKSGSMTPAWPRQLALNNLALYETYGLRARYGGFWSSRKGGLEWSDLRIYDDDWLWEQIRMARAIRDQQLFLAQPTNLCNSSCSVKEFCKAVGGPLSVGVPQPIFFDVDATMTQEGK